MICICCIKNLSFYHLFSQLFDNIIKISMYLISKGVTLWLIISSIIVIFDGCYILLRPHTLKGGKY